MASTTTTLTSLSSTKQSLRELCVHCGGKPYDFICICGQKLDFNCIQRHIEQIGQQFNTHYQQVGETLTKMNSLRGRENNQSDSLQKVINNWREKRLQDINLIADEALNNSETQTNIDSDVSTYHEIYSQLSNDSHEIGHDSLDKIVELNTQIQKRIEDMQNTTTVDYNDAILDAALQAKLQPSVTLSNLSASSLPNKTNSSDSPTNRVELRDVARTNSIDSPTNRVESSDFVRTNAIDSPTNHVESRDFVRTNVIDSPTNRVELRDFERTNSSLSSSEAVVQPQASNTSSTARTEARTLRFETPTPRMPVPEPAISNTNETKANSQSPRELTNTYNETDAVTENGSSDEFDTGKTRRIQRNGAIVIRTTSEKYAGTICCHDNQLLYNSYDKTIRDVALVFIENVTNPTATKSIDWYVPNEPVDSADDDWIQDIVYSNELSGYLILNRARLRLYKADTNTLEEFRAFFGRTMKRVSCCERLIYLTSIHGSASFNGDEILILNSNKEEIVTKTLRDILPAKVNRGAGALAGEISDIAVANNNEHVTVCYRLERRHEVGVCVFKLANNCKDWLCIKQLVLNDCWHSDLSYTPRIDWSEKLQVFMLIEYMTGHLIMIDTDGQVEGECRFMQVENRRDSPINLSVSENWLGVRYDTSLVIHKIKA